MRVHQTCPVFKGVLRLWYKAISPGFPLVIGVKGLLGLEFLPLVPILLGDHHSAHPRIQVSARPSLPFQHMCQLPEVQRLINNTTTVKAYRFLRVRTSQHPGLASSLRGLSLKEHLLHRARRKSLSARDQWQALVMKVMGSMASVVDEARVLPASLRATADLRAKTALQATALRDQLRAARAA